MAVDQIEGGRKVSAVLGRLGWPYVFDGSSVTPEAVLKAVQELETVEGRELLEKTRRRAVALSREALTASIAAIKAHLVGQHGKRSMEDRSA